jgi:hypothetical protein
VADLADKQPDPPLQRTSPWRNPSNQAAEPPRDVTKTLEKSFTQVIGDDKLFRKTVQTYKNAGNDEVAKSDDANTINDKNNADLNDAEVNKAYVATHAIESTLTIDVPPRDVINDDELFSKTVKIDKNVCSDEVAESNEANNVEYTLVIEDNKANESLASPVVTPAIELSIPAEANEANLLRQVKMLM